MTATNTFVPKVVRWPAMPLHPEPGEPIVVRTQVDGARPEMRRKAREVVLSVLHSWGYPDARLLETPTGPVIFNPGAENIGVGLSYAENTAWIALRVGAGVGIDAMMPSDFQGLRAVATRYLGPAETEHILSAPDRARAFAVAWTRHEARFKLVRRELVPHAEGTPAPAAQAHTLRIGAYLVSVAY